MMVKSCMCGTCAAFTEVKMHNEQIEAQTGIHDLHPEMYDPCRECFHCESNASALGARTKRYKTDGAVLQQLYWFQLGLCGICRTEIYETTFVIDHNHYTGRVRGLLCPRDNSRLGKRGAVTRAEVAYCLHPPFERLAQVLQRYQRGQERDLTARATASVFECINADIVAASGWRPPWVTSGR